MDPRAIASMSMAMTKDHFSPIFVTSHPAGTSPMIWPMPTRAAIAAARAADAPL